MVGGTLVSVLIRGVTSLKRDNLIVFYYICISVHQKSGLISGGGDFGECPYKRETTSL